MFVSTNKALFGFLVAVGLAIGMAAGIPSIPAAQEPDLYSMPPDEFFRIKRVQQPIDLSNIDQELLSAAVFQETNRIRKEHRLASLAHVPGLEEAARMHARNMAEGNYLSHTNPEDPERRTPWDRVRLAGLDPSYVAENVATHFGIQYEPGTEVYIIEKEGRAEYRETRDSPPIPNHTYRTFAKTLLAQWMDSTGHRRNILSERAESLGAACAKGNREGMPKFYCVQVFAGDAVLPVYADQEPTGSFQTAFRIAGPSRKMIRVPSFPDNSGNADGL